MKVQLSEHAPTVADDWRLYVILLDHVGMASGLPLAAQVADRIARAVRMHSQYE